MPPSLIFIDSPRLERGFMDDEEHDLVRIIASTYNEPLVHGMPTTRDSVEAGETISRCIAFVHSAYSALTYRLADVLHGQNGLVDPVLGESKSAITPLTSQMAQVMAQIQDLIPTLRPQLVTGAVPWSESREPVGRISQLVKETTTAWPSSREILNRNISQLQGLLFHPVNPIPYIVTPILQLLGLVVYFPRIRAWAEIRRYSNIINSLDASVTCLGLVHAHLAHLATIINRVNYNPKTLSEDTLDHVSASLTRYYGTWGQVTNYASTNAEEMNEIPAKMQTLFETLS